MTVKEFSVKHRIPYHVVYKASYIAKPLEESYREREYDEDDLYNESLRYIKKRLREIKFQYEQYVDAFHKLKHTENGL